MKIIRREDITKKGSPIKYFDVHALCQTIEKMPKYSNGHKRIYVGHTSNDTYPIGIINNPIILSPDSNWACVDWIAFYSRDGGEMRINVDIENSSEYYICDKDWTNDDTIKPINLSDFIKEETHYIYKFYDKNDEDGILVPGDIIRLTLVDITSDLQKVYGIVDRYDSNEMLITFVDPSLVERWRMDHISGVTNKIHILADNIWKPDVKEFEIERLYR